MTAHNGSQQLSGRWRNALWLIIGLLLAGVLLFTANWEAERHEQVRMKAFHGDVMNLARISESIIAGQLREYDNILLVLRDSYADDPTGFAEKVRLLRCGPLADREILVVLNDREGNVIYTDAPNAKPGLNMSWSAYFRYFADGGKDCFLISAPVFGRVTNRYSIPLVRPLYDKQGGFFGVVALSVRQDSLANFGPRLQLSGDTTITVVTYEGEVAARSRDLAKMQGTKLPKELMAPMLNGQEGVFSSRAAPDGVERVIAYRHIQETPLIVYVESSPGNLLRETSLQRSLLLWGTGFTSLVVMVLIVVYLKGRKTTAQLIDTLRRSKEKAYKTLTGTSLDGFWVVDSSGRILDANATICTLLGYTQEELLCLSVTDIEATESPEQVAAHVHTVTETGSDRFQARHRRKDGTIIDVEISAQYVKESGGRYFVFIRDITERKQAEESLRKSEEKYHNLYLHSALGIFHSTFEGRFIDVNPALAKMLGYNSPEEATSSVTNIAEQVYMEPPQRDAISTAALESGGTISVENRYRRRDGSLWHGKLHLRIVPDQQGKPAHYEGLIEDITERKQAEEEKVKLEGQLQQAQKMEAIGQLAGGVAHDFNNMLGVIIGHAEMALDELDPAQPLFKNLEEIRKAATRSADTTRQLLAFARKQAIAPEVLDLNETVEGILKMLRRLIGEDIDLAWLPGAGLWPIKMDPSQIDQILANLCVNARDAIAGVGKMTVETGNISLEEEHWTGHEGFVPGEYVRIAVSDSGSGIDNETLSHIFEPFFTTKGIGEGTGLGLATVYGAVKQNNGFIYAYSEPGQGTTFSIYLPRHVGEAQQVRKEDAAEPAVHGRETILLVEDEPTMLEMTTTMLQRLGYNVLAASTPGKAIRLVNEFAGEIHLFLTDVIMPEMNGRDLAHRLLANQPGIKCLFMSGYTADIITRHGMLDEGVCFIEKPFSKKDLAAKVRDALDQIETKA